MFSCERCGLCCRKVGQVFFAKDMTMEDGTCKYLDKKSNLCGIYTTRPLFCNVDAFYDAYFISRMTREEFYYKNKMECKRLHEENVKNGS